MSATSVLAVCILLLTVVYGDLSPQCQPEVVESCASQLKSLYNSQDGPVIVKNESELKTLCNHQQQALVCINNYVEICLQEAHKNLFNNMTSGVQEFVADFCSPDSQTRKVYVKHLNCFNKVSDEVHHCTRKLHKWNKEIERKQVNREETLRESCCRYDHTMECIRTVVRNGCPDEAADLFDGMIKKVTRQFFLFAKCGSYNYVISECSGASGLASTAVLSLASLLFVLFTMFNKFW